MKFLIAAKKLISSSLQDRAQKIMDAMDLLDKGDIDIFGFLTRIVALNERFSKQDLFNSVDSETKLCKMSPELKSSTSSLSSNASNLSQLSDESIVQMNPCNVCLTNPKSVLLRPCNHVNICAMCWDQILSHNEDNSNRKPKCPSCNQEVIEAILNVFIYN